jgi:hypothetical protein
MYVSIKTKALETPPSDLPLAYAMGSGASVGGAHSSRTKKLGIRVKNRRLVWAGVENDILITSGFLIEVLMWLPYLSAQFWMGLIKSVDTNKRPTLVFFPAKPGPWYLLMGAAAWGGVKIGSGSCANAHTVYFEDLTQAADTSTFLTGAINGRCTDIRKSYVASVFETVFGYPLALDPTSYHGRLVKKPETNGTHGGCVLIGPVLPVIGAVYQKLIDTADENNQCNDLRTPCIGGQPVFVWRKRKHADKRFGIENQSATLHQVEEIFSAEEIALIVTFNAAMGLDCGGLDILRDKSDGRIYIVDVNKTDVGPLIALKWSVKMKSMQLLGTALRAWLNGRQGAAQSEDAR